MPAERPVRLGVVGLGRFGRLHAQTIQHLSEGQLTALVTRRPEALAAVEADFPGVPAFCDLEQAVTSGAADAWIVACSTSDHVPVTRRLLQAGATVLLEKPIANQLGEAQTLEPFVAADSRNLMLGHVVLFNSEFRQLCREVSTLSPIQYLTAARHRPDSIPSQFPGENPLIATMVHDLYLVRALLDSAEPVGWQARYHRNQDGQLDLATARLEFPGGRLADLVASYLAPSGMAPRGFDRLEVFGSGWAARLEPNPRPLQLWDTRARWPLALEIQTSPDFATGMLAEELRCFCRVVRGSQSVPAGATYADGLAIQRWMEWLAEDAANAEARPKPTNAHD